jgi:CMP-N,N'-diacetyllegionaminic acid synthase
MKILAIIPARGGSKGIPNKNIKLLLGKPLIQYTAEVALSCKDYLNRIIVSTDDSKIANIAKSIGLEVPFLRPSNMASDQAPALPYVQHALLEFKNHFNENFDAVLILQPTNPLRNREDIIHSIELMKTHDCDSVISHFETDKYHPVFMKKISSDGFIAPFHADFIEKEGLRRQDVTPKALRRDGAIYLVKTEVVLSQNSLWGKKIFPYIIPEERSIGIDTPKDWGQVEQYLLNN